VQYNAGLGRFDVTATRDDNFSIRSGTRDVFRVQVQGPQALALMQDATGNRLPETKFFHIGEFQIAGKPVRALRHGMAGTPGFEIYGPWADQIAVREALEKAGEKYGMRKVGALAYSATAQESGWMPMPLPAIYHGEAMKPYRQWLNNYFLETIASLGGSLVSDKIEDYYVDPIEVGYGGLVDYGRDFIGRDALRKRADNPKRKKVTLVWNTDDVFAVNREALAPKGKRAKYIAFPLPMYATFESDAVVRNGRTVGVSQWSCWSANAEALISLALVDLEHAAVGTELTLLWGEPDSKRWTVESHTVREIRVKVANAPYFEKVIKTGAQ
jgi:vanillate/3-O-methylgallate O-demethylase